MGNTGSSFGNERCRLFWNLQAPKVLWFFRYEIQIFTSSMFHTPLKMHTLVMNNLLNHVNAVSEESDDTENLLSENEMLKEELKKAQEMLKNLERRVYDGLNISKRRRDDHDDGSDEAGPSTYPKKDDGNQSDKVRQKPIKMP